MRFTWLQSHEGTISPREFQLVFRISNDNFRLLGFTVGVFHVFCAAGNKLLLFFAFRPDSFYMVKVHYVFVN